MNAAERRLAAREERRQRSAERRQKLAEMRDLCISGPPLSARERGIFRRQLASVRAADDLRRAAAWNRGR